MEGKDVSVTNTKDKNDQIFISGRIVLVLLTHQTKGLMLVLLTQGPRDQVIQRG